MTGVDPNLMGYFFIILGIAFAALGVAVYLNIRAAKPAPPSVSESAPQQGFSSFKNPSGEADEAHGANPLPDHDPNHNRFPPISAPKNASQSDDEDVEPMTKIDANEADHLDKHTDLSSGETNGMEYEHLATFYREEHSKGLLIRIGDRKYASPSELRNSPYWAEIEKLSAEFAAWLRSAPERAAPSPGKPSESLPGPQARPSAPQSMVEQINQILERKLLALPEEERAVRLVEGRGGEVRVFVGVESFPISEVPYEAVRRLIREAVDEWEKS